VYDSKENLNARIGDPFLYSLGITAEYFKNSYEDISMLYDEKIGILPT